METLSRIVHFRYNKDMDVREDLKEKRLFIDYKGLCVSLQYEGLCEDDMILHIASDYQSHQIILPDAMISFICRILLLVNRKESYIVQTQSELLSFLDAYPSILEKQQALEQHRHPISFKLASIQTEFANAVRALQFNQSVLDNYFLKCTQWEVIRIKDKLL